MSENQEDGLKQKEFIMGILNNLEAYMEAEMSENQEAILNKSDTDLCHYCQNKAKYTDVAEIDLAKYGIIGVCQCHYVQDIS